MAVEVAERGALALEALAQEAPERRGVRGPVVAVAHQEEHRDVERPLDVLAVAEALLEGEGQEAAAVGIGVRPDVQAARDEAVGLALGDARVGEDRRDDRRDGERDAQLRDHVRLVRVVEVRLHGGGREHHLERQRIRASAGSFA